MRLTLYMNFAARAAKNNGIKANIIFSSSQVAVWITISERASFPVSDDRRSITNQQRSL